MWELLAIFLIAILGGAIPLMVRWSDRSLHVALALSTGLFLGAVFLHLLPELSATVEAQAAAERVAQTVAEHTHAPGESHDHASEGHAGHGHSHGPSLPWLFVLLGALAVYLFEALFLRTHDHDDRHRHHAVSIAAMAGLSVHALTAGVSYGLAIHGPDAGHSLLVAVLAHKGFEAFSLVNVFQLAGLKRRTIIILILAFAAVTPLGAGLGNLIAQGAGDSTFALLQAVAAGTFLYVCMGELLPEVFHHREDSVIKLVLLAMGVVFMWYLHGIGV